ncbi:S-adenosyl-L-methionine-dependent methyltransferase [Aspergillus ambiguus]|uniref:S-adenosyl-L-methionine-dependent methyltransferase n=1 Tax=Aspergillus ambiguus TaxID=176160 RepID=UPI003CCCECCF
MGVNVDTFISQIESLDIPTNEHERRRLGDAVSKLQERLEASHDFIVGLVRGHVEMALIRVGVELGLFRHLANQESQSQTVSSLANALGASPSLLVRILRFLSSVGIIQETGPNLYCGNAMTHVLASEAGECLLIHAFDNTCPAIQSLPQFLVDNNYHDITESNNTPFQKAFNTDLPVFEWLAKSPRLFKAGQGAMQAFGSSDWMNGFNTVDDTVAFYLNTGYGEQETVRRPLFVDVGGGYGHQCTSLRDRYPTLAEKPGSIVLQDKPETLKDLKIAGVDIVPHDIFTEQPIKGAHIYYIRRVLHDWPDELCTEILSYLADAMASDSMIMIDEAVLPTTKVPWLAALMDITMMASFASKVRSRDMWEEIAQKVGLKVKNVHIYDENMALGVVVLVK